MSNKVPLMNKEYLETLHTGTLMSRRLALLKCEDSFKKSDNYTYKKEPLTSETSYIEFKNTSEWVQAYKDVKQVLSVRKNIPNKQERKMQRQKKGKF